MSDEITAVCESQVVMLCVGGGGRHCPDFPVQSAGVPVDGDSDLVVLGRAEILHF